MKRISKRARVKKNRHYKALLRRRAKLTRHNSAWARGKHNTRGSPLPQITEHYTAKVTAPQVFALETEVERNALLEFLATLRSKFSDERTKTVLIDFSSTRSFYAPGTLLFYAELRRLLDYAAGRIHIRCTRAQNVRANQVLGQIGVFSLCGQKSPAKPTLGDVVNWRVAHGQLVDNNICAPAIEPFEGKIAEPLVNGIFRGLGEAMTNAKHHAYTGLRQDGLSFKQPQQDWWMFSQLRNGMLSVVFCDLGVGIPTTLPVKQPTLFARLVSLGRASSDSACIDEAIKDSRTSTQIPGRGHGLGNIVNVVSSTPTGQVLIMSNHGCYVMKHDKVTCIDYKHSILATLIFWRVPVNGEKNGH